MSRTLFVRFPSLILTLLMVGVLLMMWSRNPDIMPSRLTETSVVIIEPPADRPPPPMEIAAPAFTFDVAPQPAASLRAPPQVIIPEFALEPVDTERYEDFEPNGVNLVAENPVSTFSIDVDTAAYANVRRFLRRGLLPPRDAVRIEELINYFDYDYAPPTDRSLPFATHIELAPSPWSNDKQLMRVALQGYDIDRTRQPPINLTLLIDVSGSMSDPNKLSLAKDSLCLLVDELGAEDHVSIAVYAGAAGTVLEPTRGDRKSAILSALDRLSAGGSTAGGEGLRLAYSLAEQNFDSQAVNRVMLLTDGDFNVGITSPERLEDFVARKREKGVYLSVLGFGEGNYNDLLMQKLAQSGNGIAAYVDTINEGRKILVDDLSGSMFPIADDVKIQVEFNPARVAEYRLIGYETRLLNREDFNNDRVDAGETGAGHSVTAIYELALRDSANRSIDERRYGSSAPSTIDEPRSNELALLRLRYKRPGETTSNLIERVITDADRRASLALAGEDTRFAFAVAAYGALLRGDPYLDAEFGYDDVVQLARSAVASDSYGYRREFLELAESAKTAKPQEELYPSGRRR